MFFVTKGVSFKPLISKSGLFCKRTTANLEVFQILWYHVRPDFGPFDGIASVLSMSTHGARTRSLVVASIHLFGGERKSAEGPQQRLSRLEHGEEDATQ